MQAKSDGTPDETKTKAHGSKPIPLPFDEW